VEIIGFFSTEHKGVFTHHDSFLHMHLITKDKEKMGHLDAATFDRINVHLPVK
jgi:acetolactate decarboxylase